MTPDPNCSVCGGAGEYEHPHNGDLKKCECVVRRSPAFCVGDLVQRKPGASYSFQSVVVAVFWNRAGKSRVVCESLKEPGMLHIFDPEQMEIRIPT